MLNDRVLNYIRKHALMRPGDRVGVAVSGGADSVALLRLLLEARAELGIVISVVHFNHKIRGAEADADEKFVRQLARGLQLEFHADSADTPAYAREHKASLEAAARKLRYAFFDRLTAGQALTRVATAHTRDDQAETVLMRFLRGSGTKGLAGIYPGIGGWMAGSVLAAESRVGEPAPPVPSTSTVAPEAHIVRPLLDVTREELRSYLRLVGQPWREDATNQDPSFARNRVRHEFIPMLRQLNPSLDQTLSETAEIARMEEEYWQEQVRCLLPKLRSQSAIENREPAIHLSGLQAQPLALQRRLLRAIAEHHGLRLEFHHVEEVLAIARSTEGTLQVELPHGWEAVRSGAELWFRNRCQQPEERPAYDFALLVPREVEVAGRTIRAELVRGEALARLREHHRAEARVSRVLLDPALARCRLRVRNWRAGDRYWPAHTAAPKKIKELLQATHIPRQRKPSWPVVVSGEEIVWVPGFPAPQQFQLRETDPEALFLEELPLG